MSVNPVQGLDKEAIPTLRVRVRQAPTFCVAPPSGYPRILRVLSSTYLYNVYNDTVYAYCRCVS